VNGLAWLPGRGLLAAAQQDGVVRVWNVLTRKLVRVLRLSPGWLRAIAWLRGGSELAAGGFDGILRIQTPSGRPSTSLVATRGSVWSVAVDTSGRLLATGADDRAARIFALR
jgi:WD40 repeat protein